MSNIERKIGTQSIYFERSSNTVYITFELPYGLPPESYKIKLTNAEDALTCYWLCCNTAQQQQDFDLFA